MDASERIKTVKGTKGYLDYLYQTSARLLPLKILVSTALPQWKLLSIGKFFSVKMSCSCLPYLSMAETPVEFCAYKSSKSLPPFLGETISSDLKETDDEL